LSGDGSVLINIFLPETQQHGLAQPFLQSEKHQVL